RRTSRAALAGRALRERGSLRRGPPRTTHTVVSEGHHGRRIPPWIRRAGRRTCIVGPSPPRFETLVLQPRLPTSGGTTVSEMRTSPEESLNRAGSSEELG